MGFYGADCFTRSKVSDLMEDLERYRFEAEYLEYLGGSKYRC
jgi:hypothetical protein